MLEDVRVYMYIYIDIYTYIHTHVCVYLYTYTHRNMQGIPGPAPCTACEDEGRVASDLLRPSSRQDLALGFGLSYGLYSCVYIQIT